MSDDIFPESIVRRRETIESGVALGYSYDESRSVGVVSGTGMTHPELGTAHFEASLFGKRSDGVVESAGRFINTFGGVSLLMRMCRFRNGG